VLLDSRRRRESDGNEARAKFRPSSGIAAIRQAPLDPTHERTLPTGSCFNQNSSNALKGSGFRGTKFTIPNLAYPGGFANHKFGQIKSLIFNGLNHYLGITLPPNYDPRRIQTPLFMTFLPIRFALHAAVSAVLLGSATANAATYHLDATTGDDSASGLSPAQAWRSLAKANATSLKPGDRLLLKAGGRWVGQLKPQGGGSNDALIQIGRYGEGPLPRIDGEGAHLDTVLLRNVPFIEIADLEITNHGPTTAPWRTGVKIAADGVGKLQRIYLRRLHVHDVNGDLRKEQEGCGIFFEARGKDSHFDGLLIEQCRVERTDRNGICQRGTGRTRSRKVIIRENTLEDIGGDGIKLWGTDGGLIEKNVVRKARARCNSKEAAAGIWPFACDDTIIQFNEVSGTLGTLDGQSFDSDYWCHRTIIQYNYSFENEGGFILICTPGNAVNDDTIIRYNISIHDGVNSARVFHFGGGAKRTHVYNNTIILGPHQNLPMLLFTEWNGGKAMDTRFTNNKFIVETGGRATYQFGPSSGNQFEHNLFAGRHEGLPTGITPIGAPTLAKPVKPLPGIESLKSLGPLLGTKSPRGRVIENNGGRDFFGNPVPRDRAPAIGAIED
jgi:hypothetical protein